MFYNGQRFLAVVAYLYIVNRRERLEEIVAQLVIVFYNQDAMQFVIVFSPEFSGKFQRNGGDIRFIEGLLILNGQSEVLELFFLFGKDDSDSTALAFGALNVYFPLCRLTSFRTSIRPIPLPVILELMAFVPRKCILNSFLCSLAGIPIPLSLTSSLQELFMS